MLLKATVLALLSLFPALYAEDSHAPIIKRSPSPDVQLRSTVSLVMVPVHITTQTGLSVTTLNKDNFHLFEDNVEQRIVTFSKDDAPLSIGLLVDSSGSMKNKIKTTSEAATAFFRTSHPSDEIFLIQFGERPKLVLPFTRDPDEICHEVGRIRPFGRTSLFDAIQLALRQMKNAHNERKVIVILSDGGDNRSRRTAREIKNAILESDVQLYAMGIFDEAPDPRRQTAEEQNGPELLSNLAALSGGRHYPVSKLEDLPAISERISNELRNQYLLGYSSTNPVLDGKFRTVKLNVAGAEQWAPMRTQYRHGYYAPLE